MKCILGLDDTDSQFGLCTTYLGYKIVNSLVELGCAITGYPRLVRLNPNVPFKTRGNAAVAIEFDCDHPDEIFEDTTSLVEDNSDVEHGANACLVLLDDTAELPFFASLYERALSEVVNKEGVLKALSARHARVFTLGNGMGVVGAAASIGFDGSRDRTYELLAYRKRENCGKVRDVDGPSVRRMDAQTFPHTFNNYDYQRDRVLLAPHGPDPVFLGIRGDSPRILVEGFRILEFSEELEGHMIFISNQGTDAHLRRDLTMPLKAYSSGRASGMVSSVSKGDGGHLYVTLETCDGSLSCAVYEPAGDLIKAAQLLMSGDYIQVAGGVRRATSLHDATINVERLEVLSLAPPSSEENPTCVRCGTRMKSEGRDKGFQCRKCRRRASEKVTRPMARGLVEGTYLPSPRAHRHLTKPLVRYAEEARGQIHPLIPGWFSRSLPKPYPMPVQSHR